MKRLVLILLVVFAATSLLAGEGKNCNIHKTKTVDLTGTVEDGGKVFRVADSGQSYTICDKSDRAATKLGESGATIAVKGKLVSCDEGKGEELVIVSAKKV